MSLTTHICATQQEAERRALEELFVCFKESCADKGHFNLAISGGSTPLPLYKLFLADPRFDAKKITFYWADERIVEYNDGESNYGQFQRMALQLGHETLNCVPLYDSTLGIIGSLQRMRQSTVTGLDYIILGIGADGHFASLFPCTQTLCPQETRILEQPAETRLTNLSVLNQLRKKANATSSTPWTDPTKEPICDYYLSFNRETDSLKERISLTHNFIQSTPRRAIYLYGSSKASVLKSIQKAMIDQTDTLPAHAYLTRSLTKHSHTDLYCDHLANALAGFTDRSVYTTQGLRTC